MFKLSSLITASFISIFVISSSHAENSIPPYSPNLLTTIKKQANSIPGALPIAIHYVEYATTKRTMANVIKGGDKNQTYILPRSAYQIIYPTGTIMVDSGMPAEMNQFFGKAKDQTYNEDTNNAIQQALLKSNKIIITHEHGDHVGGVIKTPYFNQLAPKTLLTYQQAHELENTPQMPAMKLSKEQVNQFDLFDFKEYLPVAPGVVLIKAPGHSKGGIMVYIKLQNDEQYIIAGDVSWTYQGIQTTTIKPSAQVEKIKENTEQIRQELEWLHIADQNHIHIIVSHDRKHHQDLVKNKLIIEGLK